MSPRLERALRRLRAERGRVLLSAAGIFAAGAMAGTSLTVSYGLGTGFERAAERADLPDVLASFEERDRDEVEERIDALPNVEAASYRFVIPDHDIAAAGEFSGNTDIAIVSPEGRRGYAIVDGRDLDGSGEEVVVEQGVADAWGLDVGDTMEVEHVGPAEIVGIAVGPDDVAYPLSPEPRVYISNQFGADLPVSQALIWAADPDDLDPLLVQARSLAFGLDDLEFVTQDGLRALINQAAGVVIALLIAFSLVALLAAGTMLGSSAKADVERRLSSIGVMRAVGISRLGVTRRYAFEALLVALPAAFLGIAFGALIAAGPSARLLGALNELPPGLALLPVLLATLVVVVGIVLAATTWPAWRATGRPPAANLRGGEFRGRRPRRRSRTPGGPFGLGLRLAFARRGRLVTTAATIASAAAVVLLLLGVASFLERLQSDPVSVGRQYQLTSTLPASEAPRLAALDGVEGAAPRYELEAVGSFDLGQPLQLVAYDGDPADFQAPPLDEGRRVRAPDEAEVGVGLADALGLSLGGTLAVQLPSGEEARFEVVGISRTLENDGRVAIVGDSDLLAGQPDVEAVIAVRVAPGASVGAVAAELDDASGGEAETEPVGGATTDDQTFLGVLAAVLRVVALVNLAICLYALIQALAVTVAERRGVISILRSAGAGRRSIALVLLGTALACVAIAAPVALLVERFALAPIVSGLASGFASVPLAAGLTQTLGVVAGLVVLAAIAALWVGRRIERRPIIEGLRR